MGRFWIDMENLDFAYELIFDESMLANNTEEAAVQMFDVPFAHYLDHHVPLAMMARGIWDCDTAMQYFRQLRKDGCVDNRDYGLFPPLI